MTATLTAMPTRLERLRARMAEAGITVLVSFKPEHSFYLSGFNPIIYSHPVVAILPLAGEPVLLVHALRDDHARASSGIADIRLYGAWSTKVTMGPSWLAALVRILEERGLTGATLGLEEEYLPLSRHREVAAALPTARLADVSPLFRATRLVKDADEIARARIASRIADAGMAAAIEAASGGGTEREICLASMAAMNRHWAASYPDTEVCDFGSLEGGAQNGLWTWALAGERMFMNCDNPTHRKPAPGQSLAILIWTIADGMHGENERTVTFGEPPAEARRAMEAILEIRADVAGLIRPGTPISALYDCAKEGMESRGYGRFLPGRIGHGIGLGAHEWPSLDAVTDVPLEPGMILTLEPNLRMPGICSTQISDTVLVTEGGCELLTGTEPQWVVVG